MTSTAALMGVGILSISVAGALGAMGGPRFLIGWFLAVYAACLVAVFYRDFKNRKR